MIIGPMWFSGVYYCVCVCECVCVCVLKGFVCLFIWCFWRRGSFSFLFFFFLVLFCCFLFFVLPQHFGVKVEVQKVHSNLARTEFFLEGGRRVGER